jgi:hypothetical protein
MMSLWIFESSTLAKTIWMKSMNIKWHERVNGILALTRLLFQTKSAPNMDTTNSQCAQLFGKTWH